MQSHVARYYKGGEWASSGQKGLGWTLGCEWIKPSKKANQFVKKRQRKRRIIRKKRLKSKKKCKNFLREKN